jgi:hypothetical protein
MTIYREVRRLVRIILLKLHAECTSGSIYSLYLLVSEFFVPVKYEAATTLTTLTEPPSPPSLLKVCLLAYQGSRSAGYGHPAAHSRYQITVYPVVIARTDVSALDTNGSLDKWHSPPWP